MKYCVGVDVGGTNLVAGLVDERGKLLHKESCPVDKSMDAAALTHTLAQLSRRVVEQAGKGLDEIRAVGVGIPGLVDNESGVILRTTNMPFDNTPFRAWFQKEWNVPVFVGNDANCAAIGEYAAGAAKGCDPVVMVTLGTGIGGGLVANGKLFTGFANSAMEVGHIIISPDGLDCPCGNRGCWEQYGSATALIRMTREAMVQDRDSVLWELCGGDLGKVNGRTPFDGALKEDKTALRVLEKYRRGLSVGLVALVNVLQPEMICMGGGISNAEDALLLDPLRELVAAGAYDKNTPIRMERASLGNDAGVVGAALLCDMV